MRPRNSAHAGALLVRGAGFNEAGAMRPRNSADCSLSWLSVSLLQ